MRIKVEESFIIILQTPSSLSQKSDVLWNGSEVNAKREQLKFFHIVSEMTHFMTTASSVNFNFTAYQEFLSLENNNVTLSDLNFTTTALPVHHGPPSSPYNLTQMIFIGILFTVLALLTVIGNFMVQ